MSDSKALFSERLNKALDLRKYPALGEGRISYIQEIFALSRPGANKWIHGEAIPHRKKRKEISEKLGVSLNWLETGEGDPLSRDENLYSFTNNVRESCILTPREVYSNAIDTSPKPGRESIILNGDYSPKAFVMEHRGDAMCPKFYSGCLLIVDPEVKPNDGDFVVAKTPLIPEAIFRQYVVGYDSAYLSALNPKFEPVEANGAVILGKIKEFRYKS